MLAVCALNFPSIIHHEAADGPDVQDSQAAAEASRQRISKGMRLPIQLYLRSCHRVFVSVDELHDDFIPDFPSWDAWDDGAPWEPSIFDYALGEDFDPTLFEQLESTEWTSQCDDLWESWPGDGGLVQLGACSFLVFNPNQTFYQNKWTEVMNGIPKCGSGASKQSMENLVRPIATGPAVTWLVPTFFKEKKQPPCFVDFVTACHLRCF